MEYSDGDKLTEYKDQSQSEPKREKEREREKKRRDCVTHQFLCNLVRTTLKIESIHISVSFFALHLQKCTNTHTHVLSFSTLVICNSSIWLVVAIEMTLVLLSYCGWNSFFLYFLLFSVVLPLLLSLCCCCLCRCRRHFQSFIRREWKFGHAQNICECNLVVTLCFIHLVDFSSCCLFSSDNRSTNKKNEWNVKILHKQYRVFFLLPQNVTLHGIGSIHTNK